MVNKINVSNDLETTLKGLSVSISSQIENTFTELMHDFSAKNIITTEKIEQHEHFKSLSASKEALQNQFDQLNTASQQQSISLQEKNDILVDKVASQDMTLQAAIEGNKKALQEIELTASNNQTEINQLNKQLEDIKQREQSATTDLVAAEAQISVLKQSQNEFSALEERYNTANKAKVEAMEAQSHQVETLQSELNNANSELKHFQLEQSNLVESSSADLIKERKHIAELNDQIEQLTIQLQTVNESQKKMIQLDAKQQQSIQQLGKEQKMLQNEVASNQSQQLEYQKEIQQLNTEVEKHQQQISGLTTDLSTAEETLGQSTASLSFSGEKAQIEIQELSQKLTTSESETEQNKQVLASLQKQADEDKNNWSDSLNALQEQYDSLTTELNNEKSSSGDMQPYIQSLKDEIAEAKKEQMTFQQRIDSTRARFDNDNNQARSMIKTLRDENQSLTDVNKTKVTELENQITEYRLRFEYAQKQLAKA